MKIWLFALALIFSLNTAVGQDEEEFSTENPLQTEELFFEESEPSTAENDEADSSEESSEEVSSGAEGDELDTIGGQAEVDEESEEETEASEEEIAEEEDDNYPPLTGASSNLTPKSVGDTNSDIKEGVSYSRPTSTTNKGLDPYLNKRKIRHPLSKRGLYKITKDRAFLYKIKQSEQNNYSSVKIGYLDPTNLQNSETGVTFDKIYDSSSNPLILFDYEWNAWNGFGTLTYKAGIGIFVATGHGQFDPASGNANLSPPENFTLLAFPLSAGLVYRLQYWDKQFIVPYLDGGVDLFGFTEIRDDDTGPKVGAAYMAHGAGGIAFNISSLDLNSMIELDREYGINDIYFNIEFRAYANLGGNFDFSGNVISGGITTAF